MPDEEFLLCNGSSVSSSDYPALAKALGETGTTFSLPDYRDRVPQGAGTVSPSVEVEPSVPAMEGGFSTRAILGTDGTTTQPVIRAVYDSSLTWMFWVDEYDYDVAHAAPIGLNSSSGSFSEYKVSFQASTMSSLYSGTSVQPAALTAHFLIKI